MLSLLEFRQTLSYHSTLNQKLFDGEQLKPEIKDRLITIAQSFIKDCNISPDKILDLYLVGGNANYNFTPLSDIDVHIIIDFSKIGSGSIDLEDYFKSKKELWSSTHNIKIMGYEVEMYIQNTTNILPKDQGVYSLIHNRFLIMPQRVKVDYNDPKLKQKIQKYIDQIDNVGTILDARFIKDKLKDMRTIGLHRGGEFSIENLCWKSLRNLGYIQKLQKKYKKLRDRQLSI